MIRIANFFTAPLLAISLAACAAQQHTAATTRPHNVIIYVADGLRYGSVNPTDTPGFAAVRSGGVDFANSHSMYPTLTTVNAGSIATGHYAGDHGDFANTIYPGEPWLPHSGFSRVIGFEDDIQLADMDERFGGNYLHEQGLLAAAQAHGYNVASIGKTGPTGIQMRAMPGGGEAFLIDETLGLPGGPTIPADVAAAIAAAKRSMSASLLVSVTHTSSASPSAGYSSPSA